MLTTRRTLLGAIPALVLALASAAPAQDVLTPHDVARIRAVTSSQISPDGRFVAYTLSVPREPGVDDDGGAWSELHVIDLEDGSQRPYISGKTSVRSVSWTPDGRGIAFLDKRGKDEHTSLYVLPIDGGEARRAAGLEESSISSYSFNADGTEVAVVSTRAESEDREAEKKKGFGQEIYEEDWRPAQVWIVGVDSDAEPRLVPTEGHVYAAAWSPVDDRLAISASPTALVDDRYMRQRVRVVDGATGDVLARIENPGKLGPVAWSPDGTKLAMLAAGDVHDGSAARLMVVPAAGGEPQMLLPGYPGAFRWFDWADADSIMYVASRGVWNVLEKVAATPGSEPKQLVGPGGPILSGISLSKDGQHAAFRADAPNHALEVYTMSHGDAQATRRTNSNPWLDDVRLGRQEVVRFDARDGLEIEGILIRPLDEVEGQRYPLILYVHGGPEAHHSNGWLTRYSNPGQVAAARGFAVFHTNYRGSTGYGVEFLKSSLGDPAGKEFDDLVDAVDHLIEIGLVDKDKVGVTGGSYGGYATAWCSTRYSERFAAGVMFVGISDKISKVGTTDIPDEEFYVHALKRPWDDWQFFLERSPIYHADRSRTPLLILHGKDDPRVNVGQSRELYRHLKLRGEAPVRLVLYPGEGHGNRKAAARLDYNLRSMRWFEEYLQKDGGEMPDFQLDYDEPEEETGP